ncbi:MAG: FeoA family protein [Planctomycetota bacterium]|jgi:Fe2+ transport system protein FeoA
MISRDPTPIGTPDGTDRHMRLVPLSSLRAGSQATVHERRIHCDECEVLSAMGLTEACRLRVCRVGEPCIVQIASTRLGLSAAVARNILVQCNDHPPAAAAG